MSDLRRKGLSKPLSLIFAACENGLSRVHTLTHTETVELYRFLIVALMCYWCRCQNYLLDDVNDHVLV